MKRVYISILIAVLCISLFAISLFVNKNLNASALSSAEISKNYPTIIIDAGHGGEDGGASSAKGTLEKDINLDIALTLEKMLLQGGYKVKMIRQTDVSIHNPDASTTRERKVSDIHNRVKIADSDKNNILVSVHQNHFSESKYFGTQIFYSKNHLNSQILAENIRKTVTTLLQPDNTRKIKEASNVYLLDNISVPGVIVECGFLSNPDEAYLLSQEDYRDNMAYCIYLGILEYIYLNY